MNRRPGAPNTGHRGKPRSKANSKTSGSKPVSQWDHDLDFVNLGSLGDKDRGDVGDITPKKLLDALEGKVKFKKVGLKLPAIGKDPALEAVRKHPLAIDQGNYLSTNLRRFEKKSKKKSLDKILEEGNPVFMRAVSDLPQEKQKTLLETLSKISKSLEFGGLQANDSVDGISSHEKITENMEAMSINPITTTTEGMNMNSPNRALFNMGMVADDKSVGSLGSQSLRSQSTGITSSYSTAMSYGKASVNSDHADAMNVLDKIGEGMIKYPEAVFKYSINAGRSSQKPANIPNDQITATEVIAKFMIEFNIQLSTSEVNALMKKFDTSKIGSISMGAILGNAKLIHDKTVYIEKMDSFMDFAEKQKKELAVKRAEYRAKLGGKDKEGNEIEGSYKKDAMKGVIDKLANASYIAIRAKQMKPLNIARGRIQSREFRELLLALKCELLPREVTMLERRYFIGSTASIDVLAFKQEFIQLGKDVIQEKMRHEALQSFLATLSHANKNKEGDSPSKPLNVNVNFKAGEKEKKILNNGIINALPEHMSLDFAEEWINDPLAKNAILPSVNNFSKFLSPNSKNKEDGKNLSQQGMQGDGMGSVGAESNGDDNSSVADVYKQQLRQTHIDEEAQEGLLGTNTKDDNDNMSVSEMSSITTASTSKPSSFKKKNKKKKGVGFGDTTTIDELDDENSVSSLNSTGTSRYAAKPVEKSQLSIDRGYARAMFYSELEKAKRDQEGKMSSSNIDDDLDSVGSASVDASLPLSLTTGDAGSVSVDQSGSASKKKRSGPRSVMDICPQSMEDVATEATELYMQAYKSKINYTPQTDISLQTGDVFEENFSNIDIPLETSKLSMNELKRHDVVQAKQGQKNDNATIKDTESIDGSTAKTSVKSMLSEGGGHPVRIVDPTTKKISIVDIKPSSPLREAAKRGQPSLVDSGLVRKADIEAMDDVDLQFKKASLGEQQSYVDALEKSASNNLSQWKEYSDALFFLGQYRYSADQHMDALAAFERSYRMLEAPSSTVKLHRLYKLIKVSYKIEYMQKKCKGFCQEYLNEQEELYSKNSVEYSRASIQCVKSLLHFGGKEIDYCNALLVAISTTDKVIVSEVKTLLNKIQSVLNKKTTVSPTKSPDSIQKEGMYDDGDNNGDYEFIVNDEKWYIYASEEGHPYFYNEMTQVTQWEDPRGQEEEVYDLGIHTINMPS